MGLVRLDVGGRQGPGVEELGPFQGLAVLNREPLAALFVAGTCEVASVHYQNLGVRNNGHSPSKNHHIIAPVGNDAGQINAIAARNARSNARFGGYFSWNLAIERP